MGCDHKWHPHPVEYRDDWPAGKRWMWQVCKRCGFYRNTGAA